jgi:APA family basic amino acid/polyamine antiporter
MNSIHPATDPEPPPVTALPRVLGPIAALSTIVGSVIGSGIFIVPARVAHEVPAIGPIVLLWVAGGLFSLAGALTLSELAAMLPGAGGPYVYLRAAYGPVPAFLFGWTEFLVIRSGSMATLASAFALYAAQLMSPPVGIDPRLWQAVLAVAAMAAVAAINIVGTRVGGGVQVAGTIVKVGALGLMIALPFTLGAADPGRLRPIWPGSTHGLLTGIMVAMVSVLWAYDGWINTTALAEEIREPEKNVPRALILGIAILIAIYLAMTLVYHMVLPLSEIATASNEKGSPRAVAADFCRRLLGGPGGVAIALVVMTSTFISLNGNALSGPRAYFAMARDRLFPAALCRVHPHFRTPAYAIAAQSAWAIALTIAGSAFLLVSPPARLPVPVRSAWATLHTTPLYDVMYNYVIFGGTLIYMLTITSVFVLRARCPDLPRPYRTFGYPATPLLYIAAALFLMANMLRNNPFEAVAGLGIIVLGLPAYLVFARRGHAAGPG